MRSNISVVIPIRDEATWFAECLESVKTQLRLGPTQVIVIDDGSSGESAEYIHEVCSALLDSDDICKRISAGNAAVARNEGSKLAQHEFLYFLDADTVLDPLCLFKLWVAIEGAQVDVLTSQGVKRVTPSFAYCNFYIRGEIHSDFKTSQVSSHKSLLAENLISTNSLVRREDFPGFDEELQRFQDWALWLRMMKEDKFGVHVPEFLFTTHVAPGSISLQPGGMEHRERVLERYG